MSISDHPFSPHLRDFCYGAVDGTITTFAIVAGVAGANLPGTVVIVLGFANLLADGFSMAASSFVGARADAQVAGDKDGKTGHALRGAVVTLLAFVAVGFTPLLSYVLEIFGLLNGRDPWVVSCLLTGLTFFAIGAFKATWVKHRWWVGGMEVLAIGAVAAVIAYYCGAWLKELVGGV